MDHPRAMLSTPPPPPRPAPTRDHRHSTARSPPLATYDLDLPVDTVQRRPGQPVRGGAGEHDTIYGVAYKTYNKFDD